MICLLVGNTKTLRLALAIAAIAIGSSSVDAASDSPPILSFNRTAKPAQRPVFTPQTAPRTQTLDSQVRTAQHQASPKATSPSSPQASSPRAPQRDRRLLAPPTRSQIASPAGTPSVSQQQSPALGLPRIESFATAGAGLAIVLGLFFVCMWLLKRSGPKSTTQLPTEAVAVLGRVPLAARNFAHLLQVGNKLVLVAITPDGVNPITEVTDPAEVQRLLGLCLRNNKHSTTAEFHDVLQQLAQEPASGFLGNQAAASYASQGR